MPTSMRAAATARTFMLGILKKPFADVRYDNASLYSRFGYIIAHELAHQVESSTYTTDLVGAYVESQHAEALADIIAGRGADSQWACEPRGFLRPRVTAVVRKNAARAAHCGRHAPRTQ